MRQHLTRSYGLVWVVFVVLKHQFLACSFIVHSSNIPGSAPFVHLDRGCQHHHLDSRGALHIDALIILCLCLPAFCGSCEQTNCCYCKYTTTGQTTTTCLAAYLTFTVNARLQLIIAAIKTTIITRWWS